MTKEIAYVNCDSPDFEGEKVPFHSDFRNDATVPPEALATAQFVVQACNNHEALLKMVNELGEQLADIRAREWSTEGMNGLSSEVIDELLRRTTSVLRKAKRKAK